MGGGGGCKRSVVPCNAWGTRGGAGPSLPHPHGTQQTVRSSAHDLLAFVIIRPLLFP